MTFLVDTREIERFAARLGGRAPRQLPFALARGLTAVAREGKEAVDARIPRAFDRPTPFTRRAVGVVAARKQSLAAEIYIKPIQARYLGLQETGGVRRPRSGGRALLLPAGARVNIYGNLPRRAVARLFARPDVFSGRVGGVAGIWQRPGRSRRRSGPRLLVAYESEARYRPRFGFGETVGTVVDRSLTRQVWSAFDHALATAR